MKYNKITILVAALGMVFFNTCSVFDLEEPKPFVTFKTTVGGNGYDVALDVIERDDAYVLAGAFGPQCDIVDAFMAKVDKENGLILNLKKFGNSDQGFEENFFDIEFIDGKFRAVGFALKSLPPSDPDRPCKRDEGDYDGKLFYGFMDESFMDTVTFKYFDTSPTKWDAGFDIAETDGKTIVAGASKDNVAIRQIKADTVSKIIRSEFFNGQATNLLLHSGGRIFATGIFRVSETGFSKENIYWGEVELENEQLINEGCFSNNQLSEVNCFTFNNLEPDWDQSIVASILEMTNGNLLLSGTLLNSNGGKVIFLLELNTEGMIVGDIKILPEIGINGEVNGMVKVEDGFVLTGTAIQDTTKSDALIFKIDENKNIIWKEFHDFRGNNDWPQTIIKTYDGGFLIAGRTINDLDGIETILLIKTDAEGKVDDF